VAVVALIKKISEIGLISQKKLSNPSITLPN